MVWSGTSGDVRHPEVFHSSINDGDDKWKDPRAPFFGQNKGRVRKVAIGKTRNLLGLVFQRTLTQGNDAYEILLSLSSDQGWSWSNTVEIDHYASDQSGGTVVALEGRQGANRPEFAIVWGREFGNVRAANFDINATVRPEGTLIGTHAPGAAKVEVGALGKDGFSAVFNNGSGLANAHVRALVGRIEEGTVLLKGRYGNAFAMASRPNGPSRLAVASGTVVEAFTSDGSDWKKDDGQSTTLPFDATGSTLQSDMDDDQNLHLAILKPVPGEFQLWYLGQKDKKWQAAELIHTYKDKVDMRGFDIASTKRTVVVVGSQGFDANLFRRSLER